MQKKVAHLYLSEAFFTLSLHCIIQMYKWQQQCSSVCSKNVSSRQCSAAKVTRLMENGGLEETDTKSKSLTYLFTYILTYLIHDGFGGLVVNMLASGT